MRNRDPFAAHYEFAIAVVYPTFSLLFSGMGLEWLSIGVLAYGLAHEIFTLRKLETLEWGRKNGKWTNLFRFLYYHSSRGYRNYYSEAAGLLTSLVMTFNFYVIYEIGLFQVNFALWCYAFFTPSIIWFAKYNSGFPSAASFVEYRKAAIRPIIISIYVAITIQVAARLTPVQWVIYALAVLSTCLLEVIRQRVHYDNEFRSILKKMEESTIKLETDHDELQLHSTLLTNDNGYLVLAKGNQVIYDVDSKDTMERSLIALALIVSTCNVKIRLRNIDWANRSKLIPFYVRHLRLIAGTYEFDPTFDAEDIVFMFSENLPHQFFKESFPDIEFLREAFNNIAELDLAPVQKLRGRNYMETFFESMKRISSLPSKSHKNDS